MEIASRIADVYDLLGALSVELLSIIAFLLFAFTIIYGIHRMSAAKPIQWAVRFAVALIILHKTGDLLSHYWFAGGPLHEALAPLEDSLWLAGFACLLGAFFFSLLDAGKARDQVAEEHDALLKQMRERQQAYEALRASEKRYALLFNNSNDTIVLHDLDGDVLDVNEPALEWLGYTRDEFLALNLGDLFAPESTAETDAAFERLQRDGSVHAELRFKRKNGSVVTAEVSSSLFEMEGKTVVQGMARDISERKRAERERMALEQHMQRTQKLESLGIMAGGIAHDFNNLLTGIMGYAQLLYEELPEESRARERTHQIRGSASRAAELARQMLVYSGRTEFAIGRFDLNELIQDMAHLIESAITKRAQLDLALCAGLPRIAGDADRVRQIVTNLVTNASEALGAKGGAITLTTGPERLAGADAAATYMPGPPPEGHYVVLRVTDNGCGMDQAALRNIFDPFFTTKFAGRGLGLSTVLGIVRGHGGAIRVESEVGVGTTVDVLLPLAATPEPRQQQDKATAAGAAKGALILFVDDEAVVRDVTGEALAKEGFEVIVTVNGEEALAVFEERGQEIDLVLLDLTMPGMQGDEVFREMRRLRKDVRVLLSSGYIEEQAVERFGHNIPSGFLQKPYLPSTLTKKVREVLSCLPSEE